MKIIRQASHLCIQTIIMFLIMVLTMSCGQVIHKKEVPKSKPEKEKRVKVTVLPGIIPYTTEIEGELIVMPIPDLAGQEVLFRASYDGQRLIKQQKINLKDQILLNFPLDTLPEGTSKIDCQFIVNGEEIAAPFVQVTKLPPKPNAVKIDNVRSGLIVDGLPYLPFGFYSHVANKEMVNTQVFKGFNLFSPYSGGPHTEEQRARIREWMDQCVEVGMKVNYHIRWGETKWTEETRTQLRTEIKAFRDHPALLSWYIADEPVGKGISPEHLKKVYQFVKKIDPYHPVTVVFMSSTKADSFKDTLDIAMVDPYPIPHGSVTSVSNAVNKLSQGFNHSKPIWVVPQAFGGAEWWAREPSAQEERVMTYLAFINGATGIQYFIYTPRAHPKSPRLWAECGNLSLESAELTPALLSVEPQLEVTCEPSSVQVGAWKERGMVTILAANTVNRPCLLRVQLKDRKWTGKAKVLFENREIDVVNGAITGVIDGFGTRAYQISVGPIPANKAELDSDNLRRDPSFEKAPNVGTPDAFYVSSGKTATYFLDSRTSIHGRHSLRLTAPSGESVGVGTAFPFQQKKDVTYRLSVWAKADRQDTRLKMSMAGLDVASQEFTLTQEWKEYSFQGISLEEHRSRIALIISGPGVAWIDLFQVVPLEEGQISQASK